EHILFTGQPAPAPLVGMIEAVYDTSHNAAGDIASMITTPNPSTRTTVHSLIYTSHGKSQVIATPFQPIRIPGFQIQVPSLQKPIVTPDGGVVFSVYVAMQT